MVGAYGRVPNQACMVRYADDSPGSVCGHAPVASVRFDTGNTFRDICAVVAACVSVYVCTLESTQVSRARLTVARGKEAHDLCSGWSVTFFSSRVACQPQDLDMMGKKDEDALGAMEGGSNRNGSINANEARVV